MDKEKEIEQFAKDLERCQVYADIGGYQTDFMETARSLYYEGYRFADEVRKETAKEIYERVDKWLDEIVPHTREETILICLLGWIKTKFVIEVGE